MNSPLLVRVLTPASLVLRLANSKASFAKEYKLMTLLIIYHEGKDKQKASGKNHDWKKSKQKQQDRASVRERYRVIITSIINSISIRLKVKNNTLPS